MTGVRIDFASADPARFNQLRDDWRELASGSGLPKSGLRVSNVLPKFVNREFGYAFPSNEDLAAAIRGSLDTVKLGLSSLDAAELIERKTKTKRDDKGEAIGRLRRIYLTFPERDATKSTVASKTSRGHGVTPEDTFGGEGAKPSEVKGQKVKVEDEVKGQKRGSEGVPVPPYIPDQDIPDQDTRSGRRDSCVYAREVKGQNFASPKGQARSNPHPTPKSFGDDLDFLAAFDRAVLNLTAGQDIGGGEIDRITGDAFDAATKSDETFMPFYWSDVCRLKTGSTAEWFRYRAGQLIHRQEAA